MNKIILIAIVDFLFILNGYCQNWYPDGATWYFNKQQLLTFPAHGYTKMIVTGDTVIESRITKKIASTAHNFHTGEQEFIKQYFMVEEDSKIFHWTGSEFRLMYDFTLNPGDTLDLEVVNFDCDSVSPITVDSTVIKKINGNSIEVQYVSYTEFWPYGNPNRYKISDMIFKKIGRIEEFIYEPICRMDSAPIENLLLRCYEDSEISFKSEWWLKFFSNTPCDTLIDGSVGIQQNEMAEEIKIYPNPFRELLNLSVPTSKINSVVLLNSFGRKIGEFRPENIFFQLDTRSLQEGVYFIQITTGNFSETMKIVKLKNF